MPEACHPPGARVPACLPPHEVACQELFMLKDFLNAQRDELCLSHTTQDYNDVIQLNSVLASEMAKK